MRLASLKFFFFCSLLPCLSLGVMFAPCHTKVPCLSHWSYRSETVTDSSTCLAYGSYFWCAIKSVPSQVYDKDSSTWIDCNCNGARQVFAQQPVPPATEAPDQHTCSGSSSGSNASGKNASCPAEIVLKTGGALTSPHFPNDYPSSFDCVWVLKSYDKTKKIKASFTDFEVEHAADNPCSPPCSTCNFDWVELRDGSTAGAPSLFLGDKRCGNLIPEPVVTSGNELYVRFVTDESYQTTGWRLVTTLV